MMNKPSVAVAIPAAAREVPLLDLASRTK